MSSNQLSIWMLKLSHLYSGASSGWLLRPFDGTVVVFFISSLLLDTSCDKLSMYLPSAVSLRSSGSF